MESVRGLLLAVLALGLLATATPASAEWTRVTDVPATELFSIWANGDTIAAGADTVIYLSIDSGLSWRRSSKPVADVAAIEAIWMRNGRLYVGTFGQGAFTSDDLGATWHAFNDCLVGGPLDSQLFLSDFQVRGNALYAATEGAGVYERDLAGGGTWHPFGTVFEPNQASNVEGLALGAGRLLASAGSNGMVFTNLSGAPDWTTSNLDNVGLHPGLHPEGAIWTGSGWIVGTNLGIFRSVGGQEPWTRFDPGLGALDHTSFATEAGRVFLAIDVPTAAVIEESDDNGATWGSQEVLANVFVEKMAISGGSLYAARGDGLFRRPTGITAVPNSGRRTGLQFASIGPEPFVDRTRVRFDLPEAGGASIVVLDVMGRRVGVPVEGWWTAGPHDVSVGAQDLPPGIYTALLTANGAHESLRLVHVR